MQVIYVFDIGTNENYRPKLSDGSHCRQVASEHWTRTALNGIGAKGKRHTRFWKLHKKNEAKYLTNNFNVGLDTFGYELKKILLKPFSLFPFTV